MRRSPLWPLCMYHTHNIRATSCFGMCVSVLPARKQLCLDYIRAAAVAVRPSIALLAAFASAAVVCINKNKKPTTRSFRPPSSSSEAISTSVRSGHIHTNTPQRERETSSVIPVSLDCIPPCCVLVFSLRRRQRTTNSVVF